MRKADAELLIVQELRRKLEGKNVGAMGGYAEYLELRRERPELFQFNSPVDKWQLVQGWINKHRLLK